MTVYNSMVHTLKEMQEARREKCECRECGGGGIGVPRSPRSDRESIKARCRSRAQFGIKLWLVRHMAQEL